MSTTEKIPEIVRLAYYLELERTLPGMANLLINCEEHPGAFDTACRYWFTHQVEATCHAMRMMEVHMERIAGIVTDVSGRFLLMGRRNKEPLKGMWVLPGGKAEPGEAPTDTLRREIQEETGIISLGLLKPFRHYQHPQGGTIGYFNAVAIDMAVSPGDDLSEAKFVSCAGLRDLEITPLCQQVLRDAKWLD